MSIYITGDCHGSYKHINHFCKRMNTTKDDLMIILGDVAANFTGKSDDIERKEYLASIPIKFFCIHGNHDMRPANTGTYQLHQYKGGKVWIEQDFPTIMFAKDGEIFNFNNKKTIVIGGAYSVDKWYRLEMGHVWFPDEQPDDKIKHYVEKQLDDNNWKIDIVLSHTVPYQYMPIDLFLPFIDQSTVDQSTEEWLQNIEEKLSYDKWYAGHYHCSRKVDKIQILYNDIDIFD